MDKSLKTIKFVAHMFELVKKKFTILIGKSLKEGMDSRKISVCIALGIVLGIFPVLGTTTLLCAGAAIVLRLNLPLIQVVNYAVYPLQLCLLAFYFGVASWLSTDQGLLYSGAEIARMLQADAWGSIKALWDLTVWAILVWIASGPILALLLYAIVKPIIRKLYSKKQTAISGFQRF